MKKNFTYEDERLAKDMFENEFEKVKLNLRARLKNAPSEERIRIIREVEKNLMRSLMNKYMYE